MIHEIEYNPAYEDLFNDRKFLNFIYGGAGSGKSVFVAQREIARQFTNKERLVCVRKVHNTIKDSQYAELISVIERANLGQYFHITKSPMEIHCKVTGSDILFRGLDDVEKLKSISRPTRFWVEEANELEQKDVLQLLLRVRAEEKKRAQYTFTYNPDIDQLHWINKMYVSKGETDKVTIRHFTYKDNLKSTDEDAEFYESLKDTDPDFYKVYVLGEMANLDKPNQTIKYEWIEQALSRDPNGGELRLGVDVARYGDDKSKIGYLRGDDFYRIDTFDKLNTAQLAKEVIKVINDTGVKSNMVGIDTVGLGAGTFDYLEEDNFYCTEINSGAKPVDGKWESVYKFNNLRSQMWWYAREQLRNDNLTISLKDNQRLIEDLTAPTYRIKTGKTIEVEPKDSIKERIGRSTDDGDAFVYSLFVDKLKKEVFGIWL